MYTLLSSPLPLSTEFLRSQRKAETASTSPGLVNMHSEVSTVLRSAALHHLLPPVAAEGFLPYTFVRQLLATDSHFPLVSGRNA